MATIDEIKGKYFLYGKYLPLWIPESNVDKALAEARAEGYKEGQKEKLVCPYCGEKL